MHELVEREFLALDHPQPADTAQQLSLLINGALTIGTSQPGTRPAASARQLAEQLLRG